MIPFLEEITTAVQHLFKLMEEGFEEIAHFLAYGFEAFGQLILVGGEVLLNAVMFGFAEVVNHLFELLPGMGTAPTLGSPEWLEWVNYFYPVESLIAGLGTCIGVYVLFLSVRWALNALRAL